VESGSVYMAAAWGDAGRGLDTSINFPKALVIRIELPGCASAGGMELDLEKKAMCLCIPGGSIRTPGCMMFALGFRLCVSTEHQQTELLRYTFYLPMSLVVVAAGKFKLEKKLNHEVDDSKAKAKFDKARQVLEVTLPVIPPPLKTPRGQAASAVTASGQEPKLVQEVEGQEDAEPQPEASSVSYGEDEKSEAVEAPTKPAAKKSEVQRDFEEMMRKHDLAVSQANPKASGARPEEAAICPGRMEHLVC